MSLRYTTKEKRVILMKQQMQHLSRYEKRYKEELIQRGVSEDRIYCYGVAFKGKQVVIKMGK